MVRLAVVIRCLGVISPSMTVTLKIVGKIITFIVALFQVNPDHKLENGEKVVPLVAPKKCDRRVVMYGPFFQKYQSLIFLMLAVLQLSSNIRGHSNITFYLFTDSSMLY